MGKLVAYVMVTLDGYYEGPGGNIDWHTTDEEFAEYGMDMLNNASALIFGRMTYELMASYWPTEQAIADDPATSGKMNEVPKLVFSTTLESTPWGEWNNASLVEGDTTETVTRLKAEADKDLVILGSGTLVSSFTNLGLIDEYRILVNPIILGEGTPLFREVTASVPLVLDSTKIFQSGLVDCITS